ARRARGADQPPDRARGRARPLCTEPAHRRDRRAVLPERLRQSAVTTRTGTDRHGRPRTTIEGNRTMTRAYSAALSARFRMRWQYRAAALAGLGTQVFLGLVHMMVLGAFYAMPRAGSAPMTWAETLNYIWLGQATLMILPTWSDGEVAAMIRSG